MVPSEGRRGRSRLRLLKLDAPFSRRCKHSCSLGFVKVVQLTSDTPPYTHTQPVGGRKEGLGDSVTQTADLFIFPSDNVPDRNSRGQTGLESGSRNAVDFVLTCRPYLDMCDEATRWAPPLTPPPALLQPCPPPATGGDQREKERKRNVDFDLQTPARQLITPLFQSPVHRSYWPAAREEGGKRGGGASRVPRTPP